MALNSAVTCRVQHYSVVGVEMAPATHDEVGTSIGALTLPGVNSLTSTRTQKADLIR